MADELKPAIDALQRKLEQQMQGVSETKKAINMLLKMIDEPPMYTEEDGASGIIRPDQFYGKQFATAAAEYLTMKKSACQPSDILKGLKEGGFDFEVMGWKERDLLRPLAISLAKNNVKFHKLKNGSFGLKSWYDDEFLKKAGRQKADLAAAADKEDIEYVFNVGDYVQWEPGGVMQFKELQRISRISEDGAFAFVEGDDRTGLPISELVWHQKPKKKAGQ